MWQVTMIFESRSSNHLVTHYFDERPDMEDIKQRFNVEHFVEPWTPMQAFGSSIYPYIEEIIEWKNPIHMLHMRYADCQPDYLQVTREITEEF